MTDERLDYLADRFGRLNLRALLRISFQQYLAAPALHERTAARLRAGDGLCIHRGGSRLVALTPRAPHAHNTPINRRSTHGQAS